MLDHRLSDSGHAALPGFREGGGADGAPALDLAAAGLAPFAVASIAPKTVRACLHAATEARNCLSPVERRTIARWLLHAQAGGLVSRNDIARAVSGPMPATALRALVIRSLNALANRLDALVTDHCPTGGYGPALHFSLSHETNDLVLYFGNLLVIDVATLTQAPPEVARVAYEAMSLVQDALVYALLPHNIRRGEMLWWIDELRGEYEALVRAGVSDTVAAAEAYITENEGRFEYLTSLGDLDLALKIGAATCAPVPGWMCPQAPTDTGAAARRLAARLARLTPRERTHPWARYAAATTAALRALPPTLRTRVHRTKAWKGLEDTDVYAEGDAYFGHGLWVTTDTSIESYALDTLADNMAQVGETPVLHLRLGEVANPGLFEILEGMALGVGLLCQAGVINNTPMRNQRRR